MKSVKSAIDSILLLFFRKRLYSLIFRVFIGPFLMGFIIILVIFLVWQLLKYRDDFVGKGLELSVYGELISYLAIGLVPRTLPLAIMVSSLFTYGNLGQHNELVAIKSAGVSLTKLLLPLFMFVSAISIGSYFYQNQVMTWSNLKMYRLLWDIRQKDAAFNLTEGVFYNGLDGYRIKVQNKNDETNALYDVIIYDHTDGIGNVEVVLADSGSMLVNDAETMMILDLYSGARFAEHYPDGVNKGQRYSRAHFEHSTMNFDLTGLKMKNTPEDLFKSNRFMLDDHQLAYVIDSLWETHQDFEVSLDSIVTAHSDSLLLAPSLGKRIGLGLKELEGVQRLQALKTSYAVGNSLKYKVERLATLTKSRRGDISRVKIELSHRFTEALACLVLFLIGAPIGAVIKKGGIGAPAIFTVGFFILYYVFTITFEKYSRAGQLDDFIGGWGAMFVLVPVGVYFVYKAYRDARLFELNDRLNPLWYIRQRTKKKMLKEIDGLDKNQSIQYLNDYKENGLSFFERSFVLNELFSKYSLSPTEISEFGIEEGLLKHRYVDELKQMTWMSVVGLLCLILPAVLGGLGSFGLALGILLTIVGFYLSWTVYVQMGGVVKYFVKAKKLNEINSTLNIILIIVLGLATAPFLLFLFKRSQLNRLISEM